jgi:hypothetical protein
MGIALLLYILHLLFPTSMNLLAIYKFHSQLATYDDFDDDAVDVNGPAGLSNGLVSSKVSQFVSANLKKLKVLKLRFCRQILISNFICNCKLLTISVVVTNSKSNYQLWSDLFFLQLSLTAKLFSKFKFIP